MRRIVVVLALICLAFTLSAPVGAQISSNFGGANGGAVIIGESTSICDGSIEGALRYESVSQNIEYCDGSNWIAWGALTQAGTLTSAALDGARNVAVAGNYAYVASGLADSLSVIDISNPAGPLQVGTITSAALDGAQGVAVAGNYAYVASYIADSLSVIDISNPASPSQVGTITSAALDSARGVAVAGNYAYVASFNAYSLTVIDISNPAGPSQVGTVTSAALNGATAVAVAGNYAYVASNDAGSLSVIDISNPASPSQVGTLISAALDGARGVAVAGNYAYVANYFADSLSVIDISNPASPTQVGTITGAALDGAYSVAVAGNYAYVASYIADSLSVIDISNPAGPTQVGTVTSAALNGATAVAVAGNYAYVASYIADSLSVIDLAGTYKAAEYFDCTDDNLDTCVLDQNRSKYDTDFKPENIAGGVNILGVTGTLMDPPGPSGCANIGDLCADGTVFAGWHPITYDHLFIPTVDQEQPGSPGTYTMNWKNATGTDDINPDSDNDGQVNHANRGGAIGDFQAFQACEDLSFGGHGDWYLPSRVELYYLWSVRGTIEAGGNITNFQNTNYRSSTESSTSNAWVQIFSNGGQANAGKTTGYRVRCVRR